MGNPCRYFFENEFQIRKPEINEDKNQLKISLTETIESNFDEYYENAIIDFYSAPDVIFSYTNGNNNKNEFNRYWRYEFKKLKLIRELIELDESLNAIFEFEKYSIVHPTNLDDAFYYENVPLGKFAGMSIEEVKDYKKTNMWKLK
jgi:hypothetical protein